MTEEGTLELKINRFSEFVANDLETQLSSVPTYNHGFVWRIVVKPSGKPKTRLIFLECTGGDDNPNWSCKASVTLHLGSQKEGVNDAVVDDFIVTKLHNFCMEIDSGQLFGRHCNYIKNPDNGLIKDNTVIIRVHVIDGIPEVVRIAKITSSISDPPDGVLIVGTNRIPIQKRFAFKHLYLSFYSEYFKTMFRSEFKEGREDEIVLEEIEYEEMIELLDVIYPTIAPITAWSLKFIRKLADRFIMPVIMKRCKKALRISSINGAQKLLLAQMYNFEDLQMEFAQQYKTAEDAKKLKSEPEYGQLDYKTLALVLNSIAS